MTTSTSAPSAARRKVASGTLFHPAATAYAVFVVPASVLSMSGMAHAVPGLAEGAGHAHEMLSGFALAIVAGNQGGATSRLRLGFVFSLWILARVTFLAAPFTLPSTVANVGFAAVLAARFAPRLFASARKRRNLTLPTLLVAICASAAVFSVAAGTVAVPDAHRVQSVAILLFALLLLFVGGRIIAPAVAAQRQRQCVGLEPRRQPRIEPALVTVVATAAVASAVGHGPVFQAVASLAAAAAGLIAAARLARWRLWALRDRPDLLCLGAGYAWLAVGLILLGAASPLGLSRTAAMHAIAVGGLGTLALNVMAMSWLHKARRDPSHERASVAGTALLAVATLARLLAGLGPWEAGTLLMLAATCWSLAFALLFSLWFRLARGPGGGRAARDR